MFGGGAVEGERVGLWRQFGGSAEKARQVQGSGFLR
jgi:hypothetical protein